jgi:hypothetical protein
MCLSQRLTDGGDVDDNNAFQPAALIWLNLTSKAYDWLLTPHRTDIEVLPQPTQECPQQPIKGIEFGSHLQRVVVSGWANILIMSVPTRAQADSRPGSRLRTT